MADRSPDARERPLGLADLWRVRRSFVYRFEKRRLRLARGRVKRIWLPLSALALFLALVAVWQNAPSSSLRFVAGGFVRLSPLRGQSAVVYLSSALFSFFYYAPVAIACILCSRSFTLERADGTFDALAASPVSRVKLVSSRYFALLRPLGWLYGGLAAIAVFSTSLLPTDRLALVLARTAAGWIWLGGFLVLGGALGMYFELRLRRVGAAPFAGVGILILIVIADRYIALRQPIWRLVIYLGLHEHVWGRSWFITIHVAYRVLVAAIFMLTAFSLLRRAARNFDKWAARD